MSTDSSATDETTPTNEDLGPDDGIFVLDWLTKEFGG